MPSKSRGGLSKREYARKNGSVLKPTKGKVMDTASAQKAASSSVKKEDFSQESNALAEAQKEYLASLAPSGEENAAITAQQNLLMGQEQEAKRIGKQAIASPFIDRQTERLSSDTSERVTPLKYQIAALQSQREGRGEYAQAKSRFAEDSYNRKASRKSVSPTVNPLDEEYKQLRNENLRKTIDKKNGKGGKTPTQILASSNAEYNRRKQDDSQRGFVTLPKGQVGPPSPKVLKKKGRNA